MVTTSSVTTATPLRNTCGTKLRLCLSDTSVTAVACAYISTPHAHTALCCRVPAHSHQASPWPRRPVCGRFIPHPEQTLSGLQRAARVSAHLLLHAGTRSIFSAGCPGRRRPVETPHSRRLQQQTEKITLDWV